jgi:hypothetical protein
LTIPEAGDHIRYDAAPDILTGRDAPVRQVTVKFKAQKLFNFTHPRFQSCYCGTPPEDAYKEKVLSIVLRVPDNPSTDSGRWPDLAGTNQNQYSVEVEICINL